MGGRSPGGGGRLCRNGIQRRQDSPHVTRPGVQGFGVLAAGRAGPEMRLHPGELGFTQLTIVKCAQLTLG